MTSTKSALLWAVLGVTGVWADVPPAADTVVTSAVRLRSLRSHMHAHGVSLMIETTAPASYVTRQPDPLTVLLELPDVDVTEVANSVLPGDGGPIATVGVEAAFVEDQQTARVRVGLTGPVAHYVRSQGRVVVVEFDKASALDSLSPALLDAAGMARLLAGWLVPPDPIAVPGRDPTNRATQQPPGTAPVAPESDRVPQAPATPATGQAPSAAAVLAQPVAQQPLDRSGRAYSGDPVTFNFEDADLKSVLRAFSEVTGLNVVIDPAIAGRVNVILVEVPWDQALDVILRQNKLGYVVEGTIVRIAPLSALAEEEKQRSDLARAQAEAGQLTTLTRQLSYAKGEDLAALLKSARVLSERGDAFVDARTNTLIITDLQDRLTTASELIATLDKPQPQVEIEARIVQTTKDYARQLGVQWGFTGRVDPALGNTTNLAFPNSGTLSGQAGAPGSGTAVNLGVAGAPSAVGLALGSINGAFNLDLALSAAESAGQVRLLSTPRVSTQNNVEAEIAQGVQIPYQTVSNNTVTVQFKDAALTLRVTPQISAAGTVIMRISVDNGSRGQDVGNPPIPSINTQRANTTVLVSDGQTTVIGGIYSSAGITRSDRTPGLSRIPFLNWLFKRETTSDESTELLIFITPRIIQGVTQG